MTSKTSDRTRKGQPQGAPRRCYLNETVPVFMVRENACVKCMKYKIRIRYAKKELLPIVWLLRGPVPSTGSPIHSLGSFHRAAPQLPQLAQDCFQGEAGPGPELSDPALSSCSSRKPCLMRQRWWRKPWLRCQRYVACMAEPQSLPRAVRAGPMGLMLAWSVCQHTLGTPTSQHGAGRVTLRPSPGACL